MKTICIYHNNCFDGICAAWIVSKVYPDAEFIPANYNDSKLMTNIQQDCLEHANLDWNYIIVDFSFPRDLMKLIADKAKSIIVLDHHKTAQAACEGLDFCHFDLNESGASLAWKYFFPEEDTPLLVQYIRDRDLWRFELPDSEVINSFIQSFPMTLEDYQGLDERLDLNFEGCRQGGIAVRQYKETMVKTMCKNAAFNTRGPFGDMQYAEWQIPVVNASILFSEVGHELCKMYPGAPFAAYYFDRLKDGKRQWGLRSIGDFDVSEVAKKYDGGGHKNAAGFEQSLWEL